MADPHIERHVMGSLQALMLEPLVPDAAFALRNVFGKVQASGLDSLSPSEAIFVSSMIAEFREQKLRLALLQGLNRY